MTVAEECKWLARTVVLKVGGIIPQGGENAQP